LAFKSKNVLLECAVNQSPKSPKSLVVIIKRSTDKILLKSKFACLLNYRHLPRIKINKVHVSSENEPSRIQRVNL